MASAALPGLATAMAHVWHSELGLDVAITTVITLD